MQCGLVERKKNPVEFTNPYRLDSHTGSDLGPEDFGKTDLDLNIKSWKILVWEDFGLGSFRPRKISISEDLGLRKFRSWKIYVLQDVGFGTFSILEGLDLGGITLRRKKIGTVGLFM